MGRDFIRIYGKWILICLISMTVALGAFAVYFKIQYPRIRMRNYERTFDFIESLLQQKKWRPDLDYEFATETVRQMREMLLSGELEYADFAKLRVLNRFSREQRLMGRDFNDIFLELNRLLEAKRAGNLERMHEPEEFPVASPVEILPATP